MPCFSNVTVNSSGVMNISQTCVSRGKSLVNDHSCRPKDEGDPALRGAVDGVEQEQTARDEYAPDFGDDLFPARDVFEHIAATDDLEAAPVKGKFCRRTGLVIDGQALGPGVSARHCQGVQPR